MTCDRVPLPGGGNAIVCSSRHRPRCACGRPATLACDWKVEDKRSGTCDVPICTACTTSPEPNKDLCRKHAVELARRSGRTGVASFACLCGARDEVREPAPATVDCWSCRQLLAMHRWHATYAPPVASARAATAAERDRLAPPRLAA